ncbi:MAG: helix-turn-helix domain-containing protein [Deltaproteobacteria bacterium]|nr:helix-turn-helix domain-containing protein [Deltaproteobacteria bacterium]
MAVSSPHTKDQLEPTHLLTAKQVQRILNVSLPLVYRLAERGQLRCVRWDCPGEGTSKPRTSVRFKKSDVIDFIEQNYRNGK